MDSPKEIQYMFNEQGEKTFAVLPIDVFNKLSRVYEELDAIRTYDKAKESNHQAIPLDQMLKEVEETRNDI